VHLIPALTCYIWVKHCFQDWTKAFFCQLLCVCCVYLSPSTPARKSSQRGYQVLPLGSGCCVIPLVWGLISQLLLLSRCLLAGAWTWIFMLVYSAITVVYCIYPCAWNESLIDSLITQIPRLRGTYIQVVRVLVCNGNAGSWSEGWVVIPYIV